MNDLAIVLLSLFAQMERTYAAERAAHARAVREEKGQRTGRKIASNTERHLEWAGHRPGPGQCLSYRIGERDPGPGRGELGGGSGSSARS